MPSLTSTAEDRTDRIFRIWSVPSQVAQELGPSRIAPTISTGYEVGCSPAPRIPGIPAARCRLCIAKQQRPSDLQGWLVPFQTSRLTRGQPRCCYRTRDAAIYDSMCGIAD
jgi:hypothetical protein